MQGIWWYRDYWSNRYGLHRNIQTEDLGIDAGKTKSTGELVLKKDGIGGCDVLNNENLLFTGLVDPCFLVTQFDPEEDPEQPSSEPPSWLQPKPVVPGSFTQELRRSKSLWIVLGAFSAFFGWIIWGVCSSSTLVCIILSPVPILILGGIWLRQATVYLDDKNVVIYLYHGQSPEFHYRSDRDIPLWLDRKPYWVFRYVLKWFREFTPGRSNQLYLIKPEDYERVEVWADAETGNVEWIVSDYHWRELWYDVEPGLQNIYCVFAENFHTPEPITIKIEGREEFMEMHRYGSALYQHWANYKKHHASSHPYHWIAQIDKNSGPVVTRELSKRHWSFWRYPLGTHDKGKNYRMLDVPATGDQPSNLKM